MNHKRMFMTTLSKSSGNIQKPKYEVVQAHHRDILQIKACNEAILPENYTFDSYQRHLELWPELCLLCVDTNHKVVGYALGMVNVVSNSSKTFYDTEYTGHVYSIAVYPEYRNQGIGLQLMNELHSRMWIFYVTKTVQLHCRVNF